MSIAKRSRACLVVAALAVAGCGPDPATLWSEHCAACHGADGRGAEPHRTFYPQVDLSRSQLIADNARGPIYQRIALGWGAMPGFKHQLRQSDLERLVDFSIELGRARSDEPERR